MLYRLVIEERKTGSAYYYDRLTMVDDNAEELFNIGLKIMEKSESDTRIIIEPVVIEEEEDKEDEQQ